MNKDGIWYVGRDENGDKVYEVIHNGKDIGTFQTWDEANNALHEHLDGSAKGD